MGWPGFGDRVILRLKSYFNPLLSLAAKKGEEFPWPGPVLPAVTGGKPAAG